MKETFVGKQIERLTVLRELEPLVYVLKSGRKKGKTMKVRRYFCQCACGRTTKSRHNDLKIGHSRSCGCLRASELSVYPIGRKEKGSSYLRYMFGYYARNARVKQVSFTLTGAQFAELVTRSCFYCGQLPSERKNHSTKRLKNVFYGTMACNGIDRVDPLIGYVFQNCVPCCKTCNIAKHTMSMVEFVAWVKRVYATVTGLKSASARQVAQQEVLRAQVGLTLRPGRNRS